MRPRLQSICRAGVNRNTERIGANVRNNVEEDM
jgi:hypothetical protein